MSLRKVHFSLMTVEENLQMGAFTRKDDQIAKDMTALIERFPYWGTAKDLGRESQRR
jgi:ABC-type branched-subunit amino acid transport system ATPase component